MADKIIISTRSSSKRDHDREGSGGESLVELQKKQDTINGLIKTIIEKLKPSGSFDPR